MGDMGGVRFEIDGVDITGYVMSCTWHSPTECEYDIAFDYEADTRECDPLTGWRIAAVADVDEAER